MIRDFRNRPTQKIVKSSFASAVGVDIKPEWIVVVAASKISAWSSVGIESGSESVVVSERAWSSVRIKTGAGA